MYNLETFGTTSKTSPPTGDVPSNSTVIIIIGVTTTDVLVPILVATSYNTSLVNAPPPASGGVGTSLASITLASSRKIV